MSLQNKKREEIIQFILLNVRDHPSDIVRYTSDKFKLSSTAIRNYIHKLETQGHISILGSRKAAKYELKPIRTVSKSYSLNESIAEDKIWRLDVLPLFDGTHNNVIQICQYGFTEIFNNAIDHSKGNAVSIRITIWPDIIEMAIHDDGIGIFNKIQRQYQLDDPLHAVLELSKGKLTTDPNSHTGEGIFFTSRTFDLFLIFSGNLCFGTKKMDVLFEDDENINGTLVEMQIAQNSKKNLQEIFSQFTNDSDNYGFNKTIVPVFLVRYGSENLISRSQAKRLLTRLDRFETVVLDFKGIDIIGRAFADEIFRVFANNHPGIKLLAMNENESIGKLINEVKMKSQNAVD